MAIYHCSVKVASRSTGRSSVGMASYRSGEKIADLRTGEVYDYTRKRTDGNEILAPENSPDWVMDRSQLWNHVEQGEKRKDAQVCREVEVSLPKELGDQERRGLIREYAKEQFVSKGMVADVSFHNMKGENPHAHIMLTMRDIDENGFGQKNRDWNKKEMLEQWRDEWGKHANHALERSGHDSRIDHRSLVAQKIEREPQVHLGPNVAQMEARGIRTNRGTQAMEIDGRNEQRERSKELPHERDRSPKTSQERGPDRGRVRADVSGDRGPERGSRPQRREPEGPNSRNDGKDGSRAGAAGGDAQSSRESSQRDGGSRRELQPENVAPGSGELDRRSSSGRTHNLDLAKSIPKREDRSQPVGRGGLNLQQPAPGPEKAVPAPDGLARSQERTTPVDAGPARAAAEKDCDAFIQKQKDIIQPLEKQRKNLKDRMDQANGQVGRALKPGEVRFSVEDRAGMRDAMAKLDAGIYQERSKGEEAAVMKYEGRAEQWSKGRDLEKQAQDLYAEAKNLSLEQSVPKLNKATQLEAAAYSLKHGVDQFHMRAQDIGAARWKVGRLMNGVERMAKEGHIRKSDANHIKEGFGGGWNKKQLIDAVKILEVAKVHRDRPPEKAGQDMLKTACYAVQKCCGKGFDIGKGLEKGLPHSLDR